MTEGRSRERIVLVRLSALGDIVHTWPLAAAIKEARPECHLTWVVEHHFRSLVEGHPSIDDVVVVAMRRWRSKPFDTAIRNEVYSVKHLVSHPRAAACLDPQGLLKSALVGRWSQAVRRIGLARPWRRERLAGLFYTERIKGAVGHVVATNLEFARALGGNPDPARVPDGRWLLDYCAHRRPAMVAKKKYVVILPGAGWESKILPAATLAEAAKGLAGAGTMVVVAWGPGERDRAREIADLAGAGTETAPKTDLEELVALLGGAKLVLGGDTGPTHLAASFGVPTVAVFLSTDWRRNGPLGDRVRVISAVEERPLKPSGAAHARKVRDVEAEEILTAVGELNAQYAT